MASSSSSSTCRERQDRPSVSSFWDAYPKYGTGNHGTPEGTSTPSFWRDLVGGTIGEKYGPEGNSCAARVSAALNKAGVPIPNCPEFSTNRNYGDQSGDTPPKRYILSTIQLNNYLNTRWGEPDHRWQQPCGSGTGDIRDLDHLKSLIPPNGLAIIIWPANGRRPGHAAIVPGSGLTPPYEDGNVPYNNGGAPGNIWILN